MKLSKTLIAILLFTCWANAQDKIPTIKSGKETLRVQEGNKPVPRDNWKLTTEVDPDIYEAKLVNGQPIRVTYVTDLDSISFTVEEGKSYDFVIQKDGISYNQRVVGKRVTPIFLSARKGNAVDANPPMHGPVLDLEGGGLLVNNAIQKSIDTVRGCTNCSSSVDVVVITANADSNEAYIDLLATFNGVNSATTVVIDHPAVGDLPEAAAAVEKAEVVFFDGGNQCDYVYSVGGTKVEQAVENVYRRGGSVGGMSAGLAIQGSFVYDGCEGGVNSPEVLVDPYHKGMTFAYDFFNWPDLQNTITDTHFVKRDRMGRTLAMLARQIQDGKTAVAHAIAADEGTSVVVDKNGLGTVVGYANAYLITADHKPEVCEKGKPLTYSNFKVWKRKPGETFNLRNRPKDGFYTVSVTEGKLSHDPY